MSHPVAKPRRIAGIAAIGVATLLLISAVGLKPGSASGHAAGTVVSATAAAPAAVAPGSAEDCPGAERP